MSCHVCRYSGEKTCDPQEAEIKCMVCGRCERELNKPESCTMTATYKNPWYIRGGHYGPEYYSTTATPVDYMGYQIYERIKGLLFDVVKDGVCQTQCAGRLGAKNWIDEQGSI